MSQEIKWAEYYLHNGRKVRVLEFDNDSEYNVKVCDDGRCSTEQPYKKYIYWVKKSELQEYDEK